MLAASDSPRTSSVTPGGESGQVQGRPGQLSFAPPTTHTSSPAMAGASTPAAPGPVARAGRTGMPAVHVSVDPLGSTDHRARLIGLAGS